MTDEKKTASTEQMSELHSTLARVLQDAITHDHLVTTKDGEQVVVPPPAAILNVARQFLKDNGIEADLKSNQPLRNLADSLPTFDPEDDRRSLRN